MPTNIAWSSKNFSPVLKIYQQVITELAFISPRNWYASILQRTRALSHSHITMRNHKHTHTSICTYTCTRTLSLPTFHNDSMLNWQVHFVLHCKALRHLRVRFIQRKWYTNPVLKWVCHQLRQMKKNVKNLALYLFYAFQFRKFTVEDYYMYLIVLKALFALLAFISMYYWM